MAGIHKARALFELVRAPQLLKIASAVWASAGQGWLGAKPQNTLRSIGFATDPSPSMTNPSSRRFNSPKTVTR
jgi:hypothetical protein